jgi:hypothetical protein
VVLEYSLWVFQTQPSLSFLHSVAEPEPYRDVDSASAFLCIIWLKILETNNPKWFLPRKGRKGCDLCLISTACPVLDLPTIRHSTSWRYI